MSADAPADAAAKQSTSASLARHDAASNPALLTEGQMSGRLICELVSRLVVPVSAATEPVTDASSDILAVGLAALDIFLQANVTGPVVPARAASSIETRFKKAWTGATLGSKGENAALSELHKACLSLLEVDGVSPYAHIPHLELFCLAKHVLTVSLAGESAEILTIPAKKGAETDGSQYSLAWVRLRINVWHYKLLTQPSLGHGSNFTKSSQWSEVPSLATKILEDMGTVRAQVAGGEVWSEDVSISWSREDKTHFFIEAANNYILLGRQDKAKEALAEATQSSGLVYALSGALGKRTKFQTTDVSQLVVLARSAGAEGSKAEKAVHDEEAKPDALQLNDDTLLEEISFNKDSKDETKTATVPESLASLSPDDQPQLSPLDQIILLTEATLKDSFSPIDTLTSEEVLPFAVRVLADKSTNWQIYTQALLVRSRIEMHRSRTVERGVLQLQAVADQVLADTTAEAAPSQEAVEADDNVPAIQVTSPDEKTATVAPKVPSSFFPAPKPSESAPAQVRLQYLEALSAPPRWHLESELAYAWAGVGSLGSALEIFKRLRLWPEVALCYASAAAVDDEEGRGSGGDEKAKAIIRWRLFHRTGHTDSHNGDDVEDILHTKASEFEGPERSPAPPNAPRLWCILGDLDDEPRHYERAWEISKQRYSRAQKSLGEYYLQKQEWTKAQEAYQLATSVNRLNPELWSRLGDISLRLGHFEEAADAFGRSIGSANDSVGGEDARTWSNLGSALWSLYCEVVARPAEDVPTTTAVTMNAIPADDEDESMAAVTKPKESHDPSNLLSKALAAYKKGASIAHDNWRIWDNVLTLAARMQPPAVPDMILALTHMLKIRPSEDTLDADVLSALVQNVVLSKDKTDSGADIYEPPRGSMERLVIRLLEEQVVPLITQRAELWSLVSRVRGWRRDYPGAVDAAERAWRASTGGAGSGGLLAGEKTANDAADWTVDEAAWQEVVKRTDDLVSMLENYGADVPSVGARWKSKARMAVLSVMRKGKESWEDTEGWNALVQLMEGLKST